MKVAATVWKNDGKCSIRLYAIMALLFFPPLFRKVLCSLLLLDLSFIPYTVLHLPIHASSFAHPPCCVLRHWCQESFCASFCYVMLLRIECNIKRATLPGCVLPHWCQSPLHPLLSLLVFLVVAILMSPNARPSLPLPIPRWYVLYRWFLSLAHSTPVPLETGVERFWLLYS